MEDLLEQLLEVLDGKRYENYLAVVCPFHDDHRPSMMVHEDYYRCLACEAHGKTSTLLDKIKGKPARPKLKSWHNPFTGWTRDESLSQVMKTAWRYLKANPSQGSYLKKRGIPIDVQIELGLGWRDGYHLFPIINEGKRLCGAVARCGEGLDLPAKYVIPSGQDPNFIYVPNWDLINKHSEIYCTFGILDIISLYLYNVPGFSTTTGKRINPEALDGFRKRIIFLPDRGEESEALAIASYLGWRGSVPKMYYPDDCKDINDLLTRHPEVITATFTKGKKYGNLAR